MWISVLASGCKLLPEMLTDNFSVRTSGVFLVTLRLQSTFSLRKSPVVSGPPGSAAAPAPLVEGYGVLLAREKGGWNLS